MVLPFLLWEASTVVYGFLETRVSQLIPLPPYHNVNHLNICRPILKLGKMTHNAHWLDIKLPWQLCITIVKCTVFMQHAAVHCIHQLHCCCTQHMSSPSSLILRNRIHYSVKFLLIGLNRMSLSPRAIEDSPTYIIVQPERASFMCISDQSNHY